MYRWVIYIFLKHEFHYYINTKNSEALNKWVSEFCIISNIVKHLREASYSGLAGRKGRYADVRMWVWLPKTALFLGETMFDILFDQVCVWWLLPASMGTVKILSGRLIIKKSLRPSASEELFSLRACIVVICMQHHLVYRLQREHIDLRPSSSASFKGWELSALKLHLQKWNSLFGDYSGNHVRSIPICIIVF